MSETPIFLQPLFSLLQLMGASDWLHDYAHSIIHGVDNFCLLHHFNLT